MTPGADNTIPHVENLVLLKRGYWLANAAGNSTVEIEQEVADSV